MKSKLIFWLVIVAFGIFLKFRLWIHFNLEVFHLLEWEENENITYFNWVELGGVTHVKNREFCRSDWAFSATGALEAQWYFKTGKLVSLSEQNLIDCSYDLGNNGCAGGDMAYAFEYIFKNNGINSEKSYPYQGEEYFLCYYNRSNSMATIKGWAEFHFQGDESKLLEILMKVGPISVGINLLPSFSNYTSGIYYEENCTNHIDYAVLLVGYGTSNSSDYWIIKNCMGKKWGEQGYMRLARNRNNHCGIATYGIYPIV